MECTHVTVSEHPPVMLTCVVLPLPVSPDTTSASAVARVSASCCLTPDMGSLPRWPCMADPSGLCRLQGQGVSLDGRGKQGGSLRLALTVVQTSMRPRKLCRE